jgi:hypothetical protein
MLTDIITAISGQMAADGITGVSVLFGGEHLTEHRAPPSVVFVPIGGALSGADHSGSGNPPHLATRHVQLEFHAWGVDYAGAESLYGSVWAAIHEVTGGSYKLGSEQWPPRNSDKNISGRAVVGRVTFLIPVTGPLIATTGGASVPVFTTQFSTP